MRLGFCAEFSHGEQRQDNLQHMCSTLMAKMCKDAAMILVGTNSHTL